MAEKPPFTIDLTAGEPRRMDELCDRCYLPTMWYVPVLIISEHGANEVGHIEQCEDCDTEEDEHG